MTLSTLNLEYITCLAIVQRGVLLRRFFHKLDIVTCTFELIMIYCDSLMAYLKEASHVLWLN